MEKGIIKRASMDIVEESPKEERNGTLATESVDAVYKSLGGNSHFLIWAQNNENLFYLTFWKERMRGEVRDAKRIDEGAAAEGRTIQAVTELFRELRRGQEVRDVEGARSDGLVFPVEVHSEQEGHGE